MRKYTKESEIVFVWKGNTSLPSKNGSFPRDMLVLSVMTFSVDLPGQIATDLHGFFRAHSIGNGLFNFPQEALQFPCCGSLKEALNLYILYLVCQINKNKIIIVHELSYMLSV